MIASENFDHKNIGKKLGFYFTDKLVGGNIPIIGEKGALVIKILQRYIEDEELKRGLSLVQSPIFSRTEIMEKSGHLSHYNDIIFKVEIFKDSYFILKPVTCPFHFIYFKQSIRSYDELPIGYFETATLFRKTKKGEQDGLFRTQSFTIGDSHIFCRKDQIHSELIKSLEYIINVSNKLGILNDISFVFSSGNSKTNLLGTEMEWIEARNFLLNSLLKKEIRYVENEKAAAFYGPKIDVFFTNHSGRKTAIFTIQLDFQLAKQFDLTYINHLGEKEYPIIIHRSSMSCYERMLGVLLEKNMGELPFWLAPLQIKIFVLNDIAIEYSNSIKNKLTEYGFRVKSVIVDSNKLSSKIRKEITEKTPFIVVIGEKERHENKLTVRFYKDSQIYNIDFDIFFNKLKYLSESKQTIYDLNNWNFN